MGQVLPYGWRTNQQYAERRPQVNLPGTSDCTAAKLRFVRACCHQHISIPKARMGAVAIDLENDMAPTKNNKPSKFCF